MSNVHLVAPARTSNDNDVEGALEALRHDIDRLHEAHDQLINDFPNAGGELSGLRAIAAADEHKADLDKLWDANKSTPPTTAGVRHAVLEWARQQSQQVNRLTNELILKTESLQRQQAKKEEANQKQEAREAARRAQEEKQASDRNERQERHAEMESMGDPWLAPPNPNPASQVSTPKGVPSKAPSLKQQIKGVLPPNQQNLSPTPGPSGTYQTPGADAERVASASGANSDNQSSNTTSGTTSGTSAPNPSGGTGTGVNSNAFGVETSTATSSTGGVSTSVSQTSDGSAWSVVTSDGSTINIRGSDGTNVTISADNSAPTQDGAVGGAAPDAPSMPDAPATQTPQTPTDSGNQQPTGGSNDAGSQTTPTKSGASGKKSAPNEGGPKGNEQSGEGSTPNQHLLISVAISATDATNVVSDSFSSGSADTGSTMVEFAQQLSDSLSSGFADTGSTMVELAQQLSDTLTQLSQSGSALQDQSTQNADQAAADQAAADQAAADQSAAADKAAADKAAADQAAADQAAFEKWSAQIGGSFLDPQASGSGGNDGAQTDTTQAYYNRRAQADFLRARAEANQRIERMKGFISHMNWGHTGPWEDSGPWNGGLLPGIGARPGPHGGEPMPNPEGDGNSASDLSRLGGVEQGRSPTDRSTRENPAGPFSSPGWGRAESRPNPDDDRRATSDWGARRMGRSSLLARLPAALKQLLPSHGADPSNDRGGNNPRFMDFMPNPEDPGGSGGPRSVNLSQARTSAFRNWEKPNPDDAGPRGPSARGTRVATAASTSGDFSRQALSRSGTKRSLIGKTAQRGVGLADLRAHLYKPNPEDTGNPGGPKGRAMMKVRRAITAMQTAILAERVVRFIALRRIVGPTVAARAILGGTSLPIAQKAELFRAPVDAAIRAYRSQ